MSETREALVYVVRRRACGCAEAVCVDTPERPETTREFLRDFLREFDGEHFVIDHLPLSAFKLLPFLADCPHDGAPVRELDARVPRATLEAEVRALRTRADALEALLATQCGERG